MQKLLVIPSRRYSDVVSVEKLDAQLIVVSCISIFLKDDSRNFACEGIFAFGP